MHAHTGEAYAGDSGEHRQHTTRGSGQEAGHFEDGAQECLPQPGAETLALQTPARGRAAQCGVWLFVRGSVRHIRMRAFALVPTYSHA